MSEATVRASQSGAGLIELLDRLLDCGVAVDGSVRLGLAGIELARVDLRALLTGSEAHWVRHGARPADWAGPPIVYSSPSWPDRLDADREGQRGLAGLLIAVAELLHRVLESQAVARLEGGSLSDEQAERLGDALARLDEHVRTLRDKLSAPLELPTQE